MSGPFGPAWDGRERFWFTPTSTVPLELFGVVATLWMLAVGPVPVPFLGRDGAVPDRLGARRRSRA